ncbi:MAG: hypothetical protein SGPRY_014556, partial [Prymnesium sp.]
AQACELRQQHAELACQLETEKARLVESMASEHALSLAQLREAAQGAMEEVHARLQAETQKLRKQKGASLRSWLLAAARSQALTDERLKSEAEVEATIKMISRREGRREAFSKWRLRTRRGGSIPRLTLLDRREGRRRAFIRWAACRPSASKRALGLTAAPRRTLLCRREDR